MFNYINKIFLITYNETLSPHFPKMIFLFCCNLSKALDRSSIRIYKSQEPTKTNTNEAKHLRAKIKTNS